MVKKYIGNVLLRIEVPYNCKGFFIADYAHVLEEKHLNERGAAPLNLGYDCSTGREITQAYVNSYVSANQYRNTHIAPVMQAIRKGQDIVIPVEYITIATEQPLS
ncbi:hypothetical protein J14TS5_10200 [Paenibacillus lautus]|uniref:hypothetical protein n=1 Tax=Paenibacillus lautus TaxID=1401 RepID=UPI001B25B085|nr:hypothetical protein [Paenibacillus lautus]GIO95934.1 hypothetical protein J14TS5_10200 [Paenibacillus lautus]